MYLSNFKLSFLRKRDILHVICNVSMMNTYATDCLYDQNISLKRQKKKKKYIWNRYISNLNNCYHWLSKSQNLCKHVHKIIIKKKPSTISNISICLYLNAWMKKKITTRIKTGNNVRRWGRMKRYIVPLIMKAEDKRVLKSLSSLPFLSSNYVTFNMNS